MGSIKTKNLLIMSAILSTVIFITGLFIGYTLDSVRENVIVDNIKRNELDTESFILEQQFLEELGGDKCNILSNRAIELQPALTTIGRQLGRWHDSDFKQQDFDYLKRKYFITEIRVLMLLETLQESCNSDYNTILFFYKIDDDASIRQGYVLDDLVDEQQNIVVLSIDKDYASEEPLVDLLISKYNIERAPSLVINGKQLSGFITKENLNVILN
jgi:hypothetical protein